MNHRSGPRTRHQRLAAPAAHGRRGQGPGDPAIRRCCSPARVRRRTAGRARPGGELAGAVGPGDVAGRGRCGRRGGIPGPAGPGGGAAGGPCPAASAGIAVTGVPAATLGHVHGAGGRRGAWHGPWHGVPDTPSTASAVSAITRGISAASAFSAGAVLMVKRRSYSLTLVTRFSLDRKQGRLTGGVLLIRA